MTREKKPRSWSPSARLSGVTLPAETRLVHERLSVGGRFRDELVRRIPPVEISRETGERALADARAACARANLARDRMLQARQALERARARLRPERLQAPPDPWEISEDVPEREDPGIFPEGEHREPEPSSDPRPLPDEGVEAESSADKKL